MKTNIQKIKEKAKTGKELRISLSEHWRHEHCKQLDEKWVPLEDIEALEKGLQEEIKRLNDAFLNENFTAFERNCFKASAMKLSEVLGK